MNASVGAVSPPDTDIIELTIADIQKGLRESRFTVEDLVRLHLRRIEAYEPFYNAFTFMNDEAIADAREIDRKMAAGEPLGPLAGVPVVVKEAMDFAGLPSTAGWARLSSRAGGIDLIPERDAPVVARLRAAGAIILGKTNIPAFSHDGARANSSWDGPTFNAIDRSIAPGASSSGTAMAVSGSFAVVGLAEETGGSIQNPASAQSLVGVKPTFALVANTGVAPLAGSTRDVVGPHARTVVDAALLLDVLAGYTPEDSKTVASIGKIPEGGYTSKLGKDRLRGARLGLYGPGWRTTPLSEECAALYAKAVAELTALGATVVEDPFAGSGFASLAKQDVEFDDRGLDSIAYDLELFLRRLGPSAAANSLAALKALIPEDPFASDDLLGVHLKSMPRLKDSLANPAAPPDLSEFFKLRLDYLKIFDGVMTHHRLDALAFPQMSKALPGIFDKATYPATTVSEINIAGLPGVTVPAGGRFGNDSPFSLIFVGPLWSEAELLGLAFAYEQATRHRIVPQLEAAAYAPAKAADNGSSSRSASEASH